jgi:hypothetical protein
MGRRFIGIAVIAAHLKRTPRKLCHLGRKWQNC